MNHWMSFVLYIMLHWVVYSVHAVDCPDMKKSFIIGKELMSTLNNDFCTKKFSGKNLEWLTQVALPQIMNKSFLGVNTPPNWRELINEVMTDCYKEGDLCSKTIQKEFTHCAIAKMPIILFQLAPWLSENCTQLNKTVIEHWQNKKPVVDKLVDEYLYQFK